MTKQTKHSRIFAIPAILAVIVLAACASQPSATQSNSTVPNTGASSASGGSGPAPAAGAVSFSKDIMPIFEISCVNCHGGERTSKALDLKTYTSLMAGSQSGAVIVPGNAANSMLIQSIQAGKMPKRGTPLTAQQIQMLVDWVNAGAKNN